MSIKHVLSLGVVVAATFWLTGCGKPAATKQADPANKAAAKEDLEHVHGEWWCNEHGVPEEICARCQPKVAAELKAKGDWCAKHEVPDSQCFVCHPEKEAEFAAQYEAKYGKKPPKPEADEAASKSAG